MGCGHVVLAGGSGFLGRTLAAELVQRGMHATVLTRAARGPAPGAAPGNDRPWVSFVAWDARTVGAWAAQLEGAAAVVNLTGRSVNCRHTDAHKREIMSSRVESVRAVNRAVAACARPPALLVQASSLAIYGDPGPRVCDEDAPAATDFSAEVCQAWEGAFAEIATPGVRRMILRIGFVLGRDEGALGTLAGLARWFLGGTTGNGQQYISWIHVVDFIRIITTGLERTEMAGIYNVCGPNPVTNARFMRELRRALHRPWSPPAPRPLVRVGAWLMGTEAELALTGRRCVPRRLTEAGFAFRFPDLGPALRDLLGPGSRP